METHSLSPLELQLQSQVAKLQNFLTLTKQMKDLLRVIFFASEKKRRKLQLKKEKREDKINEKKEKIVDLHLFNQLLLENT